MEQQDGTVQHQPDLPDPPLIEQAARAWGIETDYWDIWGKQHHASAALEAAILRSLGVNMLSKASLREAIELRGHRQSRSPLAPTIFLTAGRTPHEINVSLPADRQANHGDSPATLRIHLEDGSKIETEIAPGEIQAGQRLRLPGDLPLGYHQVTLEMAGETAQPSRLIVCPSRAFEPAWLQSGRAAGVAISLYGLRSQRNWGCGDATDLRALTDWVAERTGASFVALNPLHAIPNRQPYNTSPYLPNSIFYRNPIYLDIEAIPDFGSCTRAKALFESARVQKEIATLRAAELVEYERVYALKLRFLKLLFQTFLEEWRDSTARASELKKYIESEGDLLHRFAVHSALDHAIHKQSSEIWNWTGWPEQYQDPNSDATRDFARKHWRSVLFYKYMQWQLDLQLASAQQHSIERGLSIGLYHDLALATDRFGSDLWAHRDFFVSGCRVGAPPDGFSPKGQDWGFPPPNSDRHVEDGYRLFAESIRKNCRHGGALRIDHVMRFFRLYWIPDGMEATEGTYVRDRYEALLSILALESVRNQVIVIGEDLGTVPDEAREVLHRFGILSYRLLYFEQDNNGRFRPPQEYPRDALVSATTHDLPTLAGFWLGRDIEARREAGLLTDEGAYQSMRADRAREKQKLLDLLTGLKLLPDWFPRDASQVPELVGELHNAIVGFLTSTPSKLMVLNQEDLLKQAEQQNLPGSTEEYPNWRRKMKCTVEELWTSGEIQDFARMFRLWLERTGRLNVPDVNQAK
ncbi:MAG: 4-alpha-glucanotransferase [Bryobacteraceae bacterium]|jgi:4-alpha-glucanotransferase